MTVTSQVNVVTGQGNGATPAFNYSFLIPDASDAEVIFTDVNGNQTTLTSTQYTITGIGNTNGGAVIYPLSGPPIANGTTLTIARILPLVQGTSISNQGAFYPAAVEGALDYQMMALQQVQNETGRALVAPIVDINPPGPLPAVVQRANQLLGFDSEGNPIAAQPGSAPISSVMQPVVNASTLAIARTNMGLGAAADENLGGIIIDDGAGNLTIEPGGVTPAMLQNTPFTNLNSAATTDLGTVASHNVNILGTNAITSFGSTASTNFPIYEVIFNGSLVLTYNATSLILPGGASITTQAGDSAVACYLGSGNWRVLSFTAANATGQRVSIPVRQTVLSGPAASGAPSFLPATSGTLSITSQNISSAALFIATAAMGFGATGPINLVGSSSANLTWSGLTASSTVFLGLTLANGILTPFSTVTAPVYQFGGAISTTNGQYTFDYQGMQMYLGNGTTAPAVAAVFVGEAVTSGSGVTSTAAYAYQGFYDSGFTNTLPSGGTNISKPANIGVPPQIVRVIVQVMIAEHNFSVGDQISSILVQYTTASVGPLTIGANRTTVYFTTGNGAAPMFWLDKSTGVGYAPTAANYAYKIVASRGW